MIDFKKCEHFVDAVTSDSSKDFVALADRMGELDRQGANIERLLTAAVGISAAGGESIEILQKLLSQGKQWNEDNPVHLIIELGDVMRSVSQSCMCLVMYFDIAVYGYAKILE